TFHSLRHTAATIALEDGIPPHLVTAMLGHTSVATTLRLYAHATQPSIAAVADAIDARFGPRLRVVAARRNGREMVAGNESPTVAEKKACRERESNPYALTSTAP